MDEYLFTSESVAEGHPDKVADQIADAIVDAYLLNDPWAKITCHCLVKTGAVMLTGEIASHARIDIEQVVRATVKSIGYDCPLRGFDAATCAVISMLDHASVDSDRAIRSHHPQWIGAASQGVACGYACDETPQLMPASVLYAHRLMARQALLRKTRQLNGLLPDAKSQVTFGYRNGQIRYADSIVISTQHHADLPLATLREAVTEEVIKPVIPARWLTSATRLLINPAGAFTKGGPAAACGLSGRRSSTDTYGGAACHGGATLSGKDPFTIDRSAAYAARYVAKNIVAAGLATRCEVQLTWAAGYAQPVSVSINSFGTARLASAALAKLVAQHFDLSLYGIISQLDLLAPRYRQTACYGHFGRETFPWELTDKAAQLRDDAAGQVGAPVRTR